FVFPALTTTGECEIMVFEGVPGGPMDCWGDVSAPAEHLAKSKWILETFLPWEAERCHDVELTDDNGILAGRFPPTVRKPVGELPSGALVLGLADAVVLNDPITGQGSNNASKAAASYLASIREHGDGPFDRAFMEQAFDRSSGAFETRSCTAVARRRTSSCGTLRWNRATCSSQRCVSGRTRRTGTPESWRAACVATVGSTTLPWEIAAATAGSRIGKISPF